MAGREGLVDTAVKTSRSGGHCLFAVGQALPSSIIHSVILEQSLESC